MDDLGVPPIYGNLHVSTKPNKSHVSWKTHSWRCDLMTRGCDVLFEHRISHSTHWSMNRLAFSIFFPIFWIPGNMPMSCISHYIPTITIHMIS